MTPRSQRHARVRVGRDGKRIVTVLRLPTKKPWAIDVSFFTVGEDEVRSLAIAPDKQRFVLGTGRALRGYDKPQAAGGWHVLTGNKQEIDALTQAVGFQYIYDPIEDEYAHPAGIVVLTPQGQISRYLYGLDFSATDVRLALVEAADQRIGSIVDRALLICYHYDPLTGRYTPLAVNLLRGAAVAGVFGLLGLLSWLWLPELRAKLARSA